MSDETTNNESPEATEENLMDGDNDQVNLSAVEGLEPDLEPDEESEPTLEEQLASTKDQLLRAMAEAENTRKRAAREKEEMAQYAVTNFARDLLSVSDNLSRAIESLKESEDESVKGLLEGVEITEKELLKVFKKYKINKIEALDQAFDHNLHQALIEIPSEDQEPGTIVQEMQVGYTIADRLLRPSMVGVAKK